MRSPVHDAVVFVKSSSDKKMAEIVRNAALKPKMWHAMKS
jgi:hypothetical protein